MPVVQAIPLAIMSCVENRTIFRTVTNLLGCASPPNASRNQRLHWAVGLHYSFLFSWRVSKNPRTATNDIWVRSKLAFGFAQCPFLLRSTSWRPLEFLVSPSGCLGLCLALPPRQRLAAWRSASKNSKPQKNDREYPSSSPPYLPPSTPLQRPMRTGDQCLFSNIECPIEHDTCRSVNLLREHRPRYKTRFPSARRLPPTSAR